ncbi:MAG TPA: fumarylacetoacetate hydrolase family protein [bacterium]|nr:fumarylacetoacetate hydrolase family protein [bacterium]
MKLLSFRVDNRESYGLLAGNGVIDLGRRLGSSLPDLRALLAAEALDRAVEIASRASADYGADQLRLLKPIPTPGTFICVGVNYRDRNEEYKDGSDLPRYPSLFFRTPGSLVAHGEPLVRPPESEQLDYEGEIALIIGRAGRRIPEARAMEFVAGYSCVNEGTIRDWLRHGKFNVTPGKNFERSGAFGPWLVTSDEVGESVLSVTTRVNGERRQHDTTDRLMFSFPRLINYISTFCELHAGDVIATGTPTGAGARFDPPRYLRPGDVVEVEVPRVGVLRNEVIAESLS